jgi:hypothetical protein
MDSYKKYLKYKIKYTNLVENLKKLNIYDQNGGLDVAELQRQKDKLKKIYKDDAMWYDKNRPAPPAPPLPPLKPQPKPIPPAPPLPKKEETKETIRYILKPYVYIPPYRKKIYYDFKELNSYEDDEYEYVPVRKTSRRKTSRKTSRRKTSRKTSRRKTSRR